MAGITEVSLVDQSSSGVTLETNEGTMARSGIEVSSEPHRATLDFDEEYRT